MILRPRRSRTAGFLGVSVAIVAYGVWHAWHGMSGPTWAGWGLAAFGSLGVVLCVALLLPNGWYLRVEPRGFTHCHFFLAHLYRWTELQRVTVGVVGSSKSVIVEFASPGGGTRKRAFSADMYGVAVQELIDLLNRYRERYLNGRVV